MKKLILLLVLLGFVVFNYAQEREKFDPKKDPAKDVAAAVKKAVKENKFILLDVGGEWCPWCHRLDEFILANKDLYDAMQSSFVIVKVNYSKENKNEAFLSQYPKVPGYPHFFVLDKKGKFVKSHDTSNFEEGKGYSKDKLIAFAKEYKK